MSINPQPERMHDCMHRPLESLDELQPGDHVCCIYRTDEEHRAIVVPFLRAGLERNERVVYIVDARTADTILGWLREEGPDPEPFLARGQLAVLSRDEAYLRDGHFDPARMIELLQSETDRALADGYTALRVTGEMSWALRGLPGSERLLEYESGLNEFFPRHPALAVCQYDRRRFGAGVLLDILRTHPVAVIGTEVYNNFYYVPPKEMVPGRKPEAILDRWLWSLAEQKRAEAAYDRLLSEKTRQHREPEEILYAVSHDLRSPLISIEGFAAELRAGLDRLTSLVQQRGPKAAAERDRLLDEELPEALGFINAGVRKMSGLLAGLLRLSRLGRAGLTVTDLDMNRIAAETLAAMEHQARSCGATITVADLPPGRGDENQVSQVLNNLLDNAMKHRAPDRAPVIRVTGARAGGEVHYCVEDNGPGIPPEAADRLFSLFYKHDPNRPGEGLGLPITRAALDRLDGRLWFESEPGQGSRFWFALPACGPQTGDSQGEKRC